MMWIELIVVGIVALAHTAPAPFVLDAMAGDRAVWHMPRGDDVFHFPGDVFQACP
jgi:hypothetical protein